MRQLVILLLTGMLLIGCASTPEYVGEEKKLDQVWIANIEQLIEEEKLFQAYQQISYLEGQPGEQTLKRRLEELKATTLDHMVIVFHQRVDEEDYNAAIRYYHSFQAIGREELIPDWLEDELLFRQARKLADEEAIPPAYLKAMEVLRKGKPNEERLLFALRMAVKVGNNRSATKIIQLMDQEAIEVPEEYRAQIPEIPPVDQIIRGTVTIWVNRGIKIEHGVGYPDRVIGSGFFIDHRGYLLTNYHVVESEVDPKYEGYSRLYIRLSDRAEKKIPAKVVGYDRIFDLALIKTEVKPEFIFSSAGEPSIRPGDRIIAIGSPAGLENTVTSGIVSATGRRFLQIGDTMQVDVPVNPGNSGGPLLNNEGELIGVVFAGIEQFEGINFAIPFNWINKVLPRLFRGDEVAHSWLGMALYENDQGLEVIYTVPGEPASEAGLKQGDIIKALNGKEYTKLSDIQAAVLDLEPPSLVSLTWKRGDEIARSVIALQERPFSPIEVALERDAEDSIFYPLFGMKVKKVGSFLWRTDYVVKRVLQGSIADETGLSVNDPLSVQGWKVDLENRIALVKLFVKKRKSGFLQSVIQLAAYLETDIFL